MSTIRQDVAIRLLDKPQQTLRSSISCVGVGLHSGARVVLELHPAEADSGIHFVRKDRPGKVPVKALFDRVCDTTMCTTIGQAGGAMVGTVEHLMAAFAALQIDNVTVEVDGPEIPIMDGSSQPFVFLIECAGIVRQDRPRRWIEVLKPVMVKAHGKSARLEPIEIVEGAELFRIDSEIKFDHPLIKSQSLTFALTGMRFKNEIAKARS